VAELLAVVRLRGSIKARKEVVDTLRMMGLTRVNHCVLLSKGASEEGMLRKVKDMVTWGEVNKEVLVSLLRKRGRLKGDLPLTEERVRERGFSSLEELAEALLEGRVRMKDLPDLKKVFRLHPPRGGYRATKKPVGQGGDLGYRGEGINELLLRMI
jgi:large subunit ribosomal protein L30